MRKYPEWYTKERISVIENPFQFTEYPELPDLVNTYKLGNLKKCKICGGNPEYIRDAYACSNRLKKDDKGSPICKNVINIKRPPERLIKNPNENAIYFKEFLESGISPFKEWNER